MDDTIGGSVTSPHVAIQYIDAGFASTCKGLDAHATPMAPFTWKSLVLILPVAPAPDLVNHSHQ